MSKMTPYEIARETGMDRRTVLDKCQEWGVPIHEGRIVLQTFQHAMYAERDPMTTETAEMFRRQRDEALAEVERLRNMLRHGASLMNQGPAWNGARSVWVKDVESLDA